MLDTTATARMDAFLARFETALASGNVDAVTGLFAEECYWRDLVSFTWNIRTMEGRDQVRDMLKACLARVKPRPRPTALPRPGSASKRTSGVATG